MSDLATGTMPQGTTAPETQAATPAAPAEPAQKPEAGTVAKPDPQTIKLSNVQLNDRIEQGKRALLREHNLADGAALEAKLARLAELETERLSDTEKAQAEIERLKPLADKAERVAALYAAQVDAQFTTLTEAQQAAIDAHAKGDPELRVAHMRVLAAVGASAVAVPPPAPPPATTAPVEQPPTPATPRTKFEEWKAIGSKTEAAVFRRIHRREIDATEPE